MGQTIRRLVVAVTLTAGPAAAHTMVSGVDQPVTHPSAGSMIRPGATVDPGMKVIHPKVPSASPSVIKPKPVAPDGTVVVPR